MAERMMESGRGDGLLDLVGVDWKCWVGLLLRWTRLWRIKGVEICGFRDTDRWIWDLFSVFGVEVALFRYQSIGAFDHYTISLGCRHSQRPCPTHGHPRGSRTY